MKGNHCQPSTLVQAVECGVQSFRQAVEFPIDRDAQRLEHAAGGMPIPPGRRRNGPFDQFGQGAGGIDPS